jgi:hypothetical protein
MTFLMLGQMSLGLVGLRTVEADERPFCGVSLAMLVQALLAGKGGCATVAPVRPLLGVSGADVILQAPFFNITFSAEMALLPPTSCTEGNMEHLLLFNFFLFTVSVCKFRPQESQSVLGDLRRMISLVVGHISGMPPLLLPGLEPASPKPPTLLTRVRYC